MSRSLLFFGVFSNVSRYSTKMKFCFILFRFCPLKSTINSQLLWDILSRGKVIIQFLVVSTAHAQENTKTEKKVC